MPLKDLFLYSPLLERTLKGARNIIKCELAKAKLNLKSKEAVLQASFKPIQPVPAVGCSCSVLIFANLRIHKDLGLYVS